MGPCEKPIAGVLFECLHIAAAAAAAADASASAVVSKKQQGERRRQPQSDHAPNHRLLLSTAQAVLAAPVPWHVSRDRGTPRALPVQIPAEAMEGVGAEGGERRKGGVRESERKRLQTGTIGV